MTIDPGECGPGCNCSFCLNELIANPQQGPLQPAKAIPHGFESRHQTGVETFAPAAGEKDF